MNIGLIKEYWPVILIALYFGYKFYNTQKVKKMIPELKKLGAQIVDVRSPNEFMNGHNPDAINIPVNAINTGLDKLKKELPIVVCCASGSRSGVASIMLKAKGYKVYNAGRWQNTF